MSAWRWWAMLSLAAMTGTSMAYIPPHARRRLFARIPRLVRHEGQMVRMELGSGDDGASSSDEEFDLEAGIGVGIDLGTTNSAVAILKDGDKDGIPYILSIPHNGRTLPSVVSVDASDEQSVLVGLEAVEMESSNPQGTYRHVKRVMGMGGRTAALNADVVPNLWVRGSVRTAKEMSKAQVRKRRQDLLANQEPLKLSQQLQDALDDPARLLLPSNGKSVDNDDNDDDEATISPEEVSSLIVQRLLTVAQEETGRRVNRAVVGVPAYFNDAQRNATLQACELAGLEKVQLLREPEAAALAYGVGKEQLEAASSSSKSPDDSELVLVFDLGGGTYDVSVLEVGGGLMEILATSGNNMLGGSDFDYKIAAHLLQQAQKGAAQFRTEASSSYTDNDDVLSPRQNYLRNGGPIADAMVRAAEAVRIALSNARVVTLALPITTTGWLSLSSATDILAPQTNNNSEDSLVNPTTAPDTIKDGYYYCQYSRKQMEDACRDEFEALVRPIREVAIMAGALLPGDSSPSAVQAALDLEEQVTAAQQAQPSFADFYNEEADEEDKSKDDSVLLEIQAMQVKMQKKQQQRGRKRARSLAADERKFRQEKRRADEQQQQQGPKKKKARRSNDMADDDRVQDGILGRPLSQVVLVGGATRMPAIGRLLQLLTGIRPQRTVNPDEAVALGCAVQVGILDGRTAAAGLQVLNPLQAAIMRAVAQQQNLQSVDDLEDFDEGVMFSSS